jgi:hypothetical protein
MFNQDLEKRRVWRPVQPKPFSVGSVLFPIADVPAVGDNIIIQSVWVGSSLSAMEQLCIKSFLKNGHEFHLYTYEDLGGVPKGTVVKDADAIIPKKEIETFKYVANFSDLFRYTLLRSGGWYVDMDSVCLRPLQFPSEYVFAAAACDFYYVPVSNVLYSKGCFIENGYIKVPKNNSIMHYCRNLLLDWKKTENRSYCDPMLIIQDGVRKFDLQQYVQPPCVFDPLPFYRLGDVINPYVSWDLRNSYVVHLVRSGWSTGSHAHSPALFIGKDYSKECLYERLKEKYL